MSAATAARSGEAKETSKSAKKKKQKQYAIIGGIALVGLILFVGLQPIKGTIQYGICRVFIEQSVRYPSEMLIVNVVEHPAYVQVEYTTINEFGDYAAHVATCYFQQDQKGQIALRDVVMDRQKVDPKKMSIFNLTIPTIISNPPDLTVPPPIKNDILDLKR